MTEKGRRGTRKRALLVILAAVICAAAFVAVAFLSRYQRTSAERPADLYGGDVPQIHSAVDRGGDGIDDQTDILRGALAYVGTHPTYKSEYCEGRYPDDGHGVRTDVVAFAPRTSLLNGVGASSLNAGLAFLEARAKSEKWRRSLWGGIANCD